MMKKQNRATTSARLQSRAQGPRCPSINTRCPAATRRTALIVSTGTAVLSVVEEVWALPTLDLPGGLGSRGARPPALRVPRRNLDKAFAVLLMRSTYEAVDALDYIPMDQFQVQFWKLRQAEFEPYKASLLPMVVPIGDIASPGYFDFIAFCQFATLAKAIPDAPQVFQEFCGPESPESREAFVAQENCMGGPVEAAERPCQTIRRDAAIADNAELPRALQEQIGKRILAKLQAGEFQDTYFSAPPPGDASLPPSTLTAFVQELMNEFTTHGYCIRALVLDTEADSNGTIRWRTRIVAPANLWSLQALKNQGALVSDTFDAYAVQAYLRECGYLASFNMDLHETYLEQFWTASPITVES